MNKISRFTWRIPWKNISKWISIVISHQQIFSSPSSHRLAIHIILSYFLTLKLFIRFIHSRWQVKSDLFWHYSWIRNAELLLILMPTSALWVLSRQVSMYSSILTDIVIVDFPCPLVVIFFGFAIKILSTERTGWIQISPFIETLVMEFVATLSLTDTLAYKEFNKFVPLLIFPKHITHLVLRRLIWCLKCGLIFGAKCCLKKSSTFSNVRMVDIVMAGY